MTLRLTDEQARAAADSDRPVRLSDPRSGRSFVILDAEVYERLLAAAGKGAASEGVPVAEFASAWRAGWGDPEMSAYDNYEEAHRKLWPSDEATLS